MGAVISQHIAVLKNLNLPHRLSVFTYLKKINALPPFQCRIEFSDPNSVLATQLNDTSQAEAVYAQARDMFDRLAADRPVDLGLRYEQARTAIGLGRYLYGQGRLDPAEKAYEEAAALGQAHIAASTKVDGYRRVPRANVHDAASRAEL